MTATEYPIGTHVRLVRSFNGLASGSEGVVIGYYRTDPPAYAVTFGSKPIPIPPEHLVAVEAEGT